MKRCVIVGGADISDYSAMHSYFTDDDYFIYCDCGLKHLDGLQKKPDLIVGDFDSYKVARPEAETIILPCEKDDTDTVFAVKEAIKRGYDDFLLVGVVGGRFDHSLGNVSILAFLDSLGKYGKIVDDYSEMEIVSDKTAYIDDSFLYFSVLNIFGNADGINENNCKYKLNNAKITCEYQYGISNEVEKGKTAEVSVENGRLLLIKVK